MQVSSCHALAGSLCRRKKFKCHSSGRTDLIHGAPSHKVAVARRGIKLASAATNPTTVGEERRNASMIGLGYPSQDSEVEEAGLAEHGVADADSSAFLASCSVFSPAAWPGCPKNSVDAE
ncbi:hypothetical protein TRIUR3_22414 [Triticum urartu]|uniref:Uncharacterized protein n=1 Tax=Triticum urartu TaxID=4572 RepID=M7YXZ9_TRIUA|nr:hypothetical protein TRIUR3_22414 [Triticum urartu]